MQPSAVSYPGGYFGFPTWTACDIFLVCILGQRKLSSIRVCFHFQIIVLKKRFSLVSLKHVRFDTDFNDLRTLKNNISVLNPEL